MKKTGLILAALALLLFMVTPAFALDLGKGVTLDGYWTGGKVYAVSKEDQGAYEKIGLTSLKDSFYTEGEIGVRYKIVRPFIGYETLTKDYDKKSFGADVFIYSIEGAAFGIRTQYMIERKYGVDSKKFLYTGLTVRF